MMADFILLTKDTVKFYPTFGTAIVTVRPGTLTGSAKATLDGKPVCVDGDEEQVMVPGCSYTAKPPYSIPGMGTLMIQALAADQKAQKYRMADQQVLLKGKQFDAVFKVIAPAKQPPPSSAPDETQEYMGKGYFITTNKKWTAE